MPPDTLLAPDETVKRRMPGIGDGNGHRCGMDTPTTFARRPWMMEKAHSCCGYPHS